MNLTITLIIIIVTTLVSISGFGSHKVIDDLIFYPPAVSQQNQWWRFVTCGLIHADFGHLILNMYALYIFGAQVEKAFVGIFGQYGDLFTCLCISRRLWFASCQRTVNTATITITEALVPRGLSLRLYFALYYFSLCRN